MLVKLQQDLIHCIVYDGDTQALPVVQKERMQIYKNNTALTLRDVLKDTFPVTSQLIGDAFMDQTAHEFASQLPPESGDLNAYGAHFADFLTQISALNQYPYVPEMARLEWLAHECYLSPRLPALQQQDLAAAKDPANIQLYLQPHLQLLQSAWPVDTLWSAVNEQGSSLDNFNMQPADSYCALFRDGQQIAIWSIGIGAYRFMEHLQTSDHSFALAASAAVAVEPDIALDRLLAALIQQQLLVDPAEHLTLTS